MSPPHEHDYIGLSEASSENSVAGRPPALNLKETELRLGPPGSESPDRKDSSGKVGLTLGLLPHKANLFSGAKRGYSDAIDGNGKWALPGGSGSEVELGKGSAALFSPGGESAGVGGKNGPSGATVKDAAAAAKAAAGQDKKAQIPSAGADRGIAPAAKAQVVGWPPIRSYRKNTMATNTVKNKDDSEAKQEASCLYVKVSMDGAPYLRKVDLKTYCNYKELSSALEKMFSGFTIGQCDGHGIPGKDTLSESRLMDLLSGTEYVLTYEDKDGDWMLVGDVPWEMFTDSCRRLRIMKGSDAIGLAPRAMEKCKNRN